MARPAGAIGQVQERAHALYALGAYGRVGRIFADPMADKNQYLMIDSTIVRAHQ